MTRVDGTVQRYRWLAPEVIQTSAMDCGPAALTSLLEGFHIPASYGRLREACQTSVDGTSIDAIEVAARQLGLDAEQVMLPPDYLWVPAARALPALVVVRQPNGLLHFVVAWRRVGRWLQIMDPGVGRRWMTCDRFIRELHLHNFPVSNDEWYEWAITDDTRAIFASRLSAIGASPAEINDLLQRAKDCGTWHAMAGLDAALRMVERLSLSSGVRRGTQAVRLVESLFTCAAEQVPGECLVVPTSYWSVTPATTHGEASRLIFRGAVLLRIRGRLPQFAALKGTQALAPELAAALVEKPARPIRALWALMRGEGILTPLALVGAIGLAVGAVLIESLLFRGVFELASLLTVASQRVLALTALLFFIVVLWTCEWPILSESLRLGRHLEIRLRAALLEKLPMLNDRYLNSRPISDLAERSHSLSLLRTLPDLAVRFVQSCWEIIITVVGIGLIAPHILPLALAVATVSFGIPLLAQQPVREADLRVRGHTGALYGFYLDAMRGISPIRTHSAERAVRREHESLLIEWAHSAKRLLMRSVVARGIQSGISCGLVGMLVLDHLRMMGVTGSFVLLVYWALKLPSLGGRVATLALQYPAQRNIVIRLLEPLNAPDQKTTASERPVTDRADPSGIPTQLTQAPYVAMPRSGVEIELAGVTVVAAGHKILQNVNLHIQPGEHLAIVGPSGAGKSSLIGLLLGWHRADDGAVLVDRQPLSPMRLEQLRRETAWVDPSIQIWNRSLLENVQYSGKAGSYEALGSLFERTDLTNVIARLPEGLQSALGEGGSHLSGGEGQRIRFARAMWQDGVRLVLLDEPFRGLDREQRHRHLAHARQSWEPATFVCITHDVAETQSFDRVVVIENGRLVEDGPPDLLVEDPSSRYRALLESEESVRQELWAGPLWRRLWLDRGEVQESAPPYTGTPRPPRRTVAVGSGKAGHG